MYLRLFTLSEKIFPLLVNVLLSCFDGPLVALLEAVSESSLKFHELLNGEFLLGLICKSVLSVHNFINGPYACIDGCLADCKEIFGRIVPASGAGSKYIYESRTFGIDSSVSLLVEVLHVTETP